MDRQHAKEILPLMQAFADGKTIQTLGPLSNQWIDNEAPSFTLPASRYRIKPEPRVLWLVLNKDGHSINTLFNEANARKDHEYYNKRGLYGPYTLVKFVEELES